MDHRLHSESSGSMGLLQVTVLTRSQCSLQIQEKAYQAIHEVYHGAVPDPYDFNRIEYIKALHTVNITL